MVSGPNRVVTAGETLGVAGGAKDQPSDSSDRLAPSLDPEARVRSWWRSARSLPERPPFPINLEGPGSGRRQPIPGDTHVTLPVRNRIVLGCFRGTGGGAAFPEVEWHPSRSDDSDRINSLVPVARDDEHLARRVFPAGVRDGLLQNDCLGCHLSLRPPRGTPTDRDGPAGDSGDGTAPRGAARARGGGPIAGRSDCRAIRSGARPCVLSRSWLASSATPVVGRTARRHWGLTWPDRRRERPRPMSSDRCSTLRRRSGRALRR